MISHVIFILGVTSDWTGDSYAHFIGADGSMQENTAYGVVPIQTLLGSIGDELRLSVQECLLEENRMKLGELIGEGMEIKYLFWYYKCPYLCKRAVVI